MSYATIGNVKSMFRDFADNPNAAVSDDELTLFLANATAVLDAKIGTLYTLPLNDVDHPLSFAILKQINMFQVACVVDDILNSYGEADKKPGWCKKAQNLIEALVPPINPKTCAQCEPTMKLPDAPYEGTKIQQGRMTISKTSGTIFKKGENNW